MAVNVGELLAISLTWWIVSLSGVLAPGPISAMAVTEGARRGAVAGPLIVAGHAIAELGVVVALALGLNAVVGVGLRVSVDIRKSCCNGKLEQADNVSSSEGQRLETALSN